MKSKNSPVQEAAEYNLKIKIATRIYLDYPARSIRDAKWFRKVARERLRWHTGDKVLAKFQLFKGETLIKF